MCNDYWCVLSSIRLLKKVFFHGERSRTIIRNQIEVRNDRQLISVVSRLLSVVRIPRQIASLRSTFIRNDSCEFLWSVVRCLRSKFQSRLLHYGVPSFAMTVTNFCVLSSFVFGQNSKADCFITGYLHSQ